MRTSTRFAGRSAACLLVLTLLAPAAPAAVQRVRVVFELDPALRLGPRIETVVPVLTSEPGRRYVATGTNFGRAIGATYWNRPYVYWTRGTYDGPTLIGTASRVEDAPAAFARRPPEPSERELAHAALREGRPADAVAYFERQSTAGVPGGTAGWITALELSGRTGEAARVFAEQLRGLPDEGLAEAMVIDRRGLGAGPAGVRRAQLAAARYAEATSDPNGHLLLASYLWGAGRLVEAVRAIDEAEGSGLDAALAFRLRRAAGG